MNDDTIDNDIEKLATECLRQMKKRNGIAPSFLTALIEQARADERAKCKSRWVELARTDISNLQKEWFRGGYKKGQADLIENKGIQFLINSNVESDIAEIFEAIEEIKEASESLGDVGERRSATIGSQPKGGSTSPKPEKPCEHKRCKKRDDGGWVCQECGESHNYLKGFLKPEKPKTKKVR